MSVLSWAIDLCGKMEAWLVKRRARSTTERRTGVKSDGRRISDRYDTLAPKTINDASMQSISLP